jgi:predicted DNA-binding protein
MSTTSLTLPEELTLRAAAAAHALGMTPHAFLVEAIGRAVNAAEQHARLLAEARVARTEMLQTGQGYEAGDIAGYLRRRATSQATPAPAAKAWRG